MVNSKAAPTPVITGLKLSKEDKGSKVDLTLFKRLVGSLMYLTTTRPDIMYGVSLISRFMETPKESHWKARKENPEICEWNKRFWHKVLHFRSFQTHWIH
jgi:hypothetical protein